MEIFFIKALQLIFSLSIIVLVHEFGHFFFARILKIRVEKFYLFFNPWFSIFKFKPKNSHTEYGLGWLPLGGYVKISGMMDESFDEEQLNQPEQKWEFRSRPAWQRLLVMGGGVLFNFILAFFIYSVMLFHWGDTSINTSKLPLGMNYSEIAKQAGFQDGDIIKTIDGKTFYLSAGVRSLGDIQNLLESKDIVVIRNGEETNISLPDDFNEALINNPSREPIFKIIVPTTIFQVQKNSVAEKSGIKKGDIIYKINGVETPTFEDISLLLTDVANRSVPIEFIRDDDTIKTIAEFNDIPILGISASWNDAIEHKKYSILESIPEGGRVAGETLSAYIWQMKFLFSKEGVSNLGGFGTLGSMFPSMWDWNTFWSLTAFLSVAIGFFNILPIPMLDGGHIMFLLYEVITRKKPSDNFMKNVQVFGLFFLFALMILANGNDILRAFK